jgi:hypothetical protein
MNIYIYALTLGFLFAFFLHWTLRIFFMEPLRSRIAHKLIDRTLKGIGYGEVLLQTLKSEKAQKFLENELDEKVSEIFLKVRNELGIPPFLVQGSIEDKIKKIAKQEGLKMMPAFAMRVVAFLGDDEMKKTALDSLIKVFDERKFTNILWGVTFGAFTIGFFLALMTQGLVILVSNI